MSDLSQIVKAYDVRGTVPDQWDERVAEALGAAFTQLLNSTDEPGDAVVVGYDMRATSPGLAAAFAAGVRAEGRSVIEIGLASTDLLYYASGSLDLPGAMFTASHNPAQYNGIKMCRSGARPIGQESGLAEIRERAQALLDSGDARPAGAADPAGRAARPAPRLRRLPAQAGRPVGHPAAEGGRRRRQRHGWLHRSDRAGRRGPVAAAAGDRAALLRAGRQLPQPRGQPP